MVNGIVAAAAVDVYVFHTSGGIVRDGIRCSCHLHPEPPVHILLRERKDEKNGESVQRNQRLHEEDTLHLERLLQYSLKE